MPSHPGSGHGPRPKKKNFFSRMREKFGEISRPPGAAKPNPGQPSNSQVERDRQAARKRGEDRRRASGGR